MTVDELMRLLEGIPYNEEIQVAVRLADGRKFHAPIFALASKHKEAFKKGSSVRFLILTNEPWKTLTFNPWIAEYQLRS